MEIITTIFFSGCSIQLMITIGFLKYINRIANRYSYNDNIREQVEKYICETIITCIMVLIGYMIFMGMIIENIIKYEIIASIVILLCITGMHLLFESSYIQRIKQIIQEEQRVVPILYINSPETPSPITITTHIQTPTQSVICNMTHYTNTTPPTAIVNPDGSVYVVNRNK
jgi:hypothetical protein